MFFYPVIINFIGKLHQTISKLQALNLPSGMKFMGGCVQKSQNYICGFDKEGLRYH